MTGKSRTRKKARHLFGPRLTAKSFFWHRRLSGAAKTGEMREAGEASINTVGAILGTTGTLAERVWTWLHRTFPERQIYIRSDGRVQFFTFSPSLQATLAGLVLIFLGWVAFATVNVVFKDRIIAAKDHRFQQMQSAYENRLADLQISYDELNGALVTAEDKFKSAADQLQTKQNAIAGFLQRKSQIEASVAGRQPAAPLSASSASVPPATVAGGPLPEAMGGPDMPDQGAGATLTVLPEPVAPQPRTAKPAKTGMLENWFKNAVQFASALFGPSGPSAAQISAAYVQHPGLRALAEQTTRLAGIGSNETVLMAETEDALKNDIGGLRLLVRSTGINPADLERGEAEGGPEIPLDQVQVDGVSDRSFGTAYLRASAVLGQLDGLSREVSHIPLAAPVDAVAFDRSSGFGSRVDPFTGQYAFHSGIDFAGPWGARVTATAPGTVVFAGYRGGYGNMVEVDHGFGIHTRYGHLSTIGVKVGATVDKGAVLGRVGSTGRSTGPHVHYEIWFADKVRNPSTFIEAGRHVL
jgi:murein DD-endopeptidase MepM/ murein hydrolase activator NlpD